MIEYHNLNEPIYLKVKEMIINGELKPGEKIIQEKIAEQLGVSRTPLMKALLALENEFLVESIPRRGMYVKSFGEKEIFDIYICREALEGMAARLLAQSNNKQKKEQLKQCFVPFIGQPNININDYAKADEQFHSLLIKLTDNAPLDKIYFFGNIHEQVINRGLLRPPEETLDEHIKIIQAIEHGNANQAEKCAREHIEKSRILLLNH
ncbi:GntR family transcriptional regulator [Tamlana fucoidanivorans]|uniref:GntR family transcriptional regulator n=1 Tax=Allotamlana fucoidanivorans TaxID=2583814 RepID=A0A5C4SSH3_9FLAO|nr:GntR family transcriptional regulator [Tamlana fucoidanivorans]TNJ47212.1 GntR family transcriptional regulator [Tamlana fucoidanivorans]